MKQVITYFLFFLVFSSSAQNAAKKNSSVEKSVIHFTFTNSYCGGARPPQEMLDQYNKKRNLSHFSVEIFSKKNSVPQDSANIRSKPLKLVKTDSAGNCFLALKPGTYAVLLTKKKNAALNINYNPLCPKMLHKEYAELVIEKGKKNYEINLHFPCDPCEPPRP